MTYLLDTNVVSEFSKRHPNPQVTAFLQARRADRSAWLSVLSLGEIRRGVEMETVRNPRAGAAIRQWLAITEKQFDDRVLPVTADIAHRWGSITADRSRPAVDSLIAATALVHDLIVVTRNERDFRALGVPVLNPWA